jgi:hypothetical protein
MILSLSRLRILRRHLYQLRFVVVTVGNMLAMAVAVAVHLQYS